MLERLTTALQCQSLPLLISTNLSEGLIGISLQQNELSTGDRDYVPSKDTMVWDVYMGFLPLAGVRSSGKP